MKENHKHIVLASLAIFLGGNLAFHALRILFQVVERQGHFSFLVFTVVFAVYRRYASQRSLGTFFTVAGITAVLSYVNLLFFIPLLSQCTPIAILGVIGMRFISVMVSAVLGLALARLIQKSSRPPPYTGNSKEDSKPNKTFHHTVDPAGSTSDEG